MSSSNGPAADPNRIIAVVTGANSGFGMGICQSLLTNLSSAGAIPPAASLPSFTSVPPSLKPLLEADGGVRAARVAARIPEPHPTLTLVLACRSEKNAIEAREKLLEEHKKLLKLRRWRGDDVPEDWEQELRIEYELVDLDSVGGDKGVLSFSRRLAQRYPHVTSLYLNAGYASFTNIVIPKFLLQMVTHGFFHALHHPRYNIEEVGKRSADGERGMVWGVNVLAPYIITKELAPLLRASPKTLPYDPRVVYTSSIEAEAEGLNTAPLGDYQLLTYEGSYRASKYMGDLVMTQLDRELGTEERPIRCISAEPGCVATNIAVSGFGAWAWLVQIKWVCYWLAFYVAHLFGSPNHPVWATAGALPMLYAALVSDTYLLPATKQPGPKLHLYSRPLQDAAVKYGEVDEWEKHADVAEGLATRCEAIRQEWHKREAKNVK